MPSASPGPVGGLRSQSHLAPFLLNLQCWVASKAFALGRAANVFDATGRLTNAAHISRVQAVIHRVLQASERLANRGRYPHERICGHKSASKRYINNSC